MKIAFKRWSASFFSWEEETNKHEIEACELAWDACKREVLKLLNEELTYHTEDDSDCISPMVDRDRLKKKIEEL